MQTSKAAANSIGMAVFSDSVRGLLPPDFEIELLCLGSEGTRRISPSDSATSFCSQAAMAGLAIRESYGGLHPAMRATIHRMRLLFQLGPQLQERLRIRSVFTAKDLWVHDKFAVGIHPDVLPDDFGGIDPESRWSVNRLLEEGKQAAQNDGVICPTTHQCICWGVDCEARLHPSNLSELSAAKIRVLLRNVLFDLGSSEVKVDAELKDRVYGRLADAMHPHLDDSDSEFNHWFFANFDGIVRQIGKRKLPDGPIDRAVVRQTMLEIVADSWHYVGRAVSDFMRIVGMAFDPPLTPDEQATFNTLYHRNPRLGDLPLILFHEQFPELRPSVLAILESPSAVENWGRFHRAFQSFATMSVRRRAADKLRKRSTKLTEKVNERPSELAGRYAPVVDPQSRSEFDEIACEILEKEGVKCCCEMRPDWQARLGDESISEIKLHVMCRRCGHQCNWKGPRTTFELEAKRVRD